MTKYLVGTIIWGIFFGFFLLVLLPLIFSGTTEGIITDGIIVAVCAFGTFANLIAYIKTKSKPKNNTQSTPPAHVPGYAETYRQEEIHRLNTRINELERQNSRLLEQLTNAPGSSSLQNEPAQTQPLKQASPAPKVPNTENKKLSEILCNIPKEIVELLWFSNGPLKNYHNDANEFNFSFAGYNLQFKTTSMSEPSAIDINLPLADSLFSPPPLGYYPLYERLSPQERTAYLNWLTDITAPIDIGYVFIFYYGLERHLFFGNAEGALNAIFTLRKHHKNSSFLGYSGDAIVLYSIIHKRWDVLQNIDAEQLSVDMSLLVAALNFQSFGAQDIVNSYKKFGFDNNRYIKNEPNLFLSALDSLLNDKYNSSDYPVYPEDFNSAKEKIQLVLANYSLLPEQRFFELPDITTSPRVHDEINSLLVNTHENVKAQLREQRKTQKTSSNA